MATKMNADLFRLVHTVTATESTRYYLHGVRVEPHPEAGVLMVAADGRRMIVAHDRDGECEQASIIKLPRFALAQCKRPTMIGVSRRLSVDLGARSATITEVTEAKGRPEKEDILLTAYNVVVDGDYPDWQRVIPHGTVEPGGATFTTFNCRYINDWAKVGAELSKATGDTPSLSIQQSGASDPTIIRWGGVENVFGVQMPMRGAVHAVLPDFMSKPGFKEAAE